MEKEMIILIEEFHKMWDAFPGPVRLIDQQHTILAANPLAIEKGFIAGICCAKVGEPSSHKGCKSAALMKTGCAQTDRPASDRIRGWVPVKDHPNIYVHYTLMIPQEEIA